MKVIVGDLAVEYRDEGSGKVVLFLHGWMNDLHSFDALAGLLCSRYRVIRLDFPGFRKSEMPKEAWDLDKYVRFVDTFVKKLNLEVDTLVGHSFGGRVILKGESAGVFNARKIVLIGSAGIAKRNTPRNFLVAVGAKIGKVLTFIPPFSFWREKLRKKLYTRIESDYASAGAMRETFLKTIAEDLSEDAKKVTAPALLIWGKNDNATPLADGERLAEMIPNAKLEILDGAGHFVHQEKPQEVADRIKTFLC
jgi:pimeloyl-ACP methyl ester carboxylesterase